MKPSGLAPNDTKKFDRFGTIHSSNTALNPSEIGFPTKSNVTT